MRNFENKIPLAKQSKFPKRFFDFTLTRAEHEICFGFKRTPDEPSRKNK